MIFKQNSEIFSEFFLKSLCTRIENQLRTTEQRQGFPAGFVRHLRIPDLGGAAVMHARRNTGKRAFTGGTQKITLEFDGGEILRSFGQVGKGPVAAGCIRNGNDHGSVQVSVGGQQLRAQGQAAGHLSQLDAGEFDPDQARQSPLAACVQLVEGFCHGWGV